MSLFAWESQRIRSFKRLEPCSSSTWRHRLTWSRVVIHWVAKVLQVLRMKFLRPWYQTCIILHIWSNYCFLFVSVIKFYPFNSIHICLKRSLISIISMLFWWCRHSQELFHIGVTGLRVDAAIYHHVYELADAGRKNCGNLVVEKDVWLDRSYIN